ncbi:hypothetical protein ACSSS7_006370 [Eimeria intestinalis]
MLPTRSSLGHWVEQRGTALINFVSPERLPLLEEGQYPTPSSRLDPLRNRGFWWPALAVALFILWTVALLSLCKSVTGTLALAGTRHRRLADGGSDGDSSDDELQAVLEECIEIEAEGGLPPPLALPPGTTALDEATAKARWVTYLREAASSFEKHGRPAATPSEETATGSSWAPGGPLPSMFTSAEYSLEGEETAPPPTSTESVFWGAQPATFSGSGVAVPGLEEGSWLGQIPPIVYEPGKEVDLASPELQEFWPSEVPDIVQKASQEGDAATAGAPGSLGVLEQPSTSGALSRLLVQSAPSSAAFGPQTHPFYRLPVLLPGAMRRVFRPDFPVSPDVPSSSTAAVLNCARNLLSKPSLNTDEAEKLMRVLETLANFALTRTAGTHSAIKPLFIVARQLGVAFLILDTMVCGLQLFGPHMAPEHWWTRFAGHFSTDYSLPFLPKNPTQEHERNRTLVRKLLSAIKMLKTGVRPNAEDVVGLKQALLCLSYSPLFFRKTLWDSWRQQNASYYGISADEFKAEADEEKKE